MPTRTLYRTWCSTCNEWELFEFNWIDSEVEENEKRCTKCKSPVDTTVTFGDIPREKILEQRKRYKAYKKSEFSRITNMMMGLNNPLADMFSENIGNTDIIENDAGQKAIDEERVRLEKEERQRRKEEVAKYHGLGRNESCRCGSGKKYKKCCLTKIQEMSW